MMENEWCMCLKLESVARNFLSTCSICGGKDAYGGSNLRPNRLKKQLTTPKGGL